MFDPATAGAGAGFIESVTVVCPSETIKTRLVDDSRRDTRRFKSFVDGTSTLYREQGTKGVYRGLFPVLMRQTANSAVRFTTYSTLKSFVTGNARPGEPLPSVLTFVLGAASGVVQVFATMPLDVVKTRMQGLDATAQYRNSFHCSARIAAEEGMLAFWRGSTPRLARLVLSGGIVFSVYERVSALFGDGHEL